ncbi:ATP-binding cassette sub-family G member 1-like isoform X2 [Belonocnema kinseyi]|uniref:ATP-binding cassette sub-family G member 1-like isoform X2 n=1 Tax=Belonocnema kinseyi TaxID=2817044 RepID=UPI00143D59EA|nr:ATP-binding cassette sub-family G member 1-like isoform X2 [Belonocnema kinseyi]
MEALDDDSNEKMKSDSEECVVDLASYKKLLNQESIAARRTKVCIQFNDLGCSFRCEKGKPKDILKGVSGRFRPGRLTAILGQSGAGKTTLLNIIAGQQASNLRGSIRMNGIEKPFESLQKQCCYVPQEIELMPLLTVKETLSIAAQLKLGRPHTSDSRELIVNEVANKLGLNDCLDTLAKSLSGGERKRLSIAVEVLTNPPVMLLDEPTSGLDSTASKQVIALLHSLAQSDCTIVCSVHQPSSQLISQFDDIFVLSQGRCLYCGPREKIVETFNEAGFACPNFYNIAEFVLEVVTEQREGNLSVLRKLNFENSQFSANESQYITEYKNCINNQWFQPEYSENGEDSKVQTRRYAASCWDQLKVLLKRAFLCIRRDKTMTMLRLAAHFIVAVLLGMVFYKFGEEASKVQSNVACLFFFLLFLFFANAMPAVQMFPIEAAVFVRENSNNWYTLHSYYISKVLSDLPMQILCPSSFLIIAYYMTGQPPEVMRFFQTWVICVLMAILAQSLGIATGATFNTDAGMFLVPALNIPMFLFAGFFLKLGEVPIYLRFLSTISFFQICFRGYFASYLWFRSTCS